LPGTLTTRPQRQFTLEPMTFSKLPDRVHAIRIEFKDQPENIEQSSEMKSTIM
jgi:hypothetical protein